ncbi:MAG: zinc metallopeptidase [Clostridia bacterium]|nr:zinc metallopeptidase [Clostridia bacterium]
MDQSSIYLLLIAAMLFSVWAQINVKSTFSKYSKLYLSSGLTGAEAARKILDSNGLYGVRIERVSGSLSDHYDPKANVIRLSDDVYGSSSASAVGVAAHEAGHAVQHAQNYFPIQVRTAIIPMCQIGSNLAWPLILLGIILSFYPLASLGVIFFSLATVFQLVTLPCEFNASARAMVALENTAYLHDNELAAARKTLRAAALTYVAALAVSLLNLLRILAIVNNNRRR